MSKITTCILRKRKSNFMALLKRCSKPKMIRSLYFAARHASLTTFYHVLVAVLALTHKSHLNLNIHLNCLALAVVGCNTDVMSSLQIEKHINKTATWSLKTNFQFMLETGNEALISKYVKYWDGGFEAIGFAIKHGFAFELHERLWNKQQPIFINASGQVVFEECQKTSATIYSRFASTALQNATSVNSDFQSKVAFCRASKTNSVGLLQLCNSDIIHNDFAMELACFDDAVAIMTHIHKVTGKQISFKTATDAMREFQAFGWCQLDCWPQLESHRLFQVALKYTSDTDILGRLFNQQPWSELGWRIKFDMQFKALQNRSNSALLMFVFNVLVAHDAEIPLWMHRRMILCGQSVPNSTLLALFLEKGDLEMVSLSLKRGVSYVTPKELWQKNILGYAIRHHVTRMLTETLGKDIGCLVDGFLHDWDFYK
jgi:hypothetical protein